MLRLGYNGGGFESWIKLIFFVGGGGGGDKVLGPVA